MGLCWAAASLSPPSRYHWCEDAADRKIQHPRCFEHIVHASRGLKVEACQKTGGDAYALIVKNLRYLVYSLPEADRISLISDREKSVTGTVRATQQFQSCPFGRCKCECPIVQCYRSTNLSMVAAAVD